MWEQREDDDSIWFALPFDALEQPVGRRSLGIFSAIQRWSSAALPS